MPLKSISSIIRMGIGPAKARLINSLNTATPLTTAVIPSTDSARQELAEKIRAVLPRMESQIETLSNDKQKWADLILDITDEALIAHEENLFESTAYADDGFMTVVLEAKEVASVLHMRLKLLETPATLPNPQQPQIPSNHNVPNDSSRRSTKLPKLQLPTYGGDYLEWDQFWQMFKVSIHESSLSKVEKFTYLKTQLTGVALDSIDGISVTEDNYDTAVALLQSRFERPPRQLIGSYYSQLKGLSVSSIRVADLQKTFDTCEKIFRSLEKAGENLDTNQSLVLDVFSKYPNQVVERLFCHHGISATSILTDVRKALKDYLKETESLSELFEGLKPFNSSRSERTSDSASRTQTKPDRSVSSALATATTEKGALERRNDNAVVPKSTCYFCGELHFNAQCTRYPNVKERLERLKFLGRCTRCLGNTHLTINCKTPAKTITCFFCRSSGDHRSAMCSEKFGSTVTSPKANESTLLNSSESSLLLTALTTASNPMANDDRVTVRVIFDSGSHRTYVTNSCAKRLKLDEVQSDPVHVAIFGTKRTLTVESRQVDIAIHLRDGTSKTIRANTTPTITSGSIIPSKLPKAVEEWLGANMRNDLADDYSIHRRQIEILIGADYFWDFVTGSRISTGFGIHLIPSSVGLLLSGRCSDEYPCEGASLLCLTETTRLPETGLVAAETKQQLKYPDIDEFWSLESIGICDNPMEDDDAIALQQFNDSVYFKEGRYHVKWPWRSNAKRLPTNYQLSLGRFRSLAKRLSASDEGIKKKYCEVIEDQLSRGIIERVDKDVRSERDTLIHYLPHHPVVRPTSSTTKVRIVYDASAKTHKDSESLNECLYRGPVMLPNLCAILIRFRLNPVGIVADIEKAFLQVALQPEDRDVTRFLWFADTTNPLIDNNIAIYRFCRVPFGVISSTFLLAATIVWHMMAWNTPTSNQIQRDIYVDNAISTVADTASAIAFYKEAKQIFTAAGMNLTQWCSNFQGFEDCIPEEDRSKQQDIKVLGMKWDSCDDTIRLNESNHLTALHDINSKRKVLTTIASLYDPLGLFQPATLAAKCFLRDLWVEKRDWDDTLSDEHEREWKVIQQRLRGLSQIRLPRCVGTITKNSFLAVFCDASAVAYAAAVYLCSDGPHRQEPHLLFAKSRLAPQYRSGREVTIPRLELLGVTIGTTAVEFVRGSLMCGNMRVVIFTDSVCVLGWLRSTKPLSTFVANRVKRINSTKHCEFRYVKSSDNPADVCTRCARTDEPLSSFWWHGPTWLWDQRDRWPESSCEPFTDEDITVIQSESKGQPVFHSMLAAQHDGTLVAGEALAENGIGVACTPCAIDPSRSSSFRRLLRVTVYCLKFLKVLVWNRLPEEVRNRLRVKPVFDIMSQNPIIEARELSLAKRLWVKTVQSECYSNEIVAITNLKVTSLVKQLDLILDNHGIIRCSGRLQNADISPEGIQPILLPKIHHITKLVIREVHLKTFHSGVAHTLSSVRREFWVPRGRSVVRKEINRCTICRKHKGPPYALPRMPPWPRERLVRSHPFQFTGLDYFGPVNVSVHGETHKMWVCLFTCLAVRAVHLEWVKDCSAISFVDCLSRFISRRGCPERVISDNAPQFRVSKSLFDKAWHQAFTDEASISYISGKGIQWSFTTELAPWQGGLYERLVGLVKQAFKNVVGRRLLKWDEFITIIYETEAVVNSRPITYVHEDMKSGFPLRPCDFLTELPTSVADVKVDMKPEGGDAGKNLLRHWKYKQRRMNQLWDVWYDQYLLALRERGQSEHRNSRGAKKEIPSEGHVVLVKNSGTPRGTWKLARVTNLIRSACDGVVRSVELKLPNGIAIRRPLNYLYPLEIENSAPEIEQNATMDIGEDLTIEPDKQSSNEQDEADNDDDAFSGFSESELLNYQQIDNVVAGNNHVQLAIERGLTQNAVILAFDVRPSL